MADGARYTNYVTESVPVDLDTAIRMIEAGDASDTLSVDLGEGCIARADGRLGLQGLLQRLRGHRALTTMAYSEGGGSVHAMRPGVPDMHPDVVEILDALKLHP